MLEASTRKELDVGGFYQKGGPPARFAQPKPQFTGPRRWTTTNNNTPSVDKTLRYVNGQLVLINTQIKWVQSAWLMSAPPQRTRKHTHAEPHAFEWRSAYTILWGEGVVVAMRVFCFFLSPSSSHAGMLKSVFKGGREAGSNWA